MELERVPKPGEIYRHFKNNLYQIITVATHTETRERMVVYQALYGEFKTYVRPLNSFMSEVDHKKYPEVRQKFRFELVSNLGVLSEDGIRMTNKENLTVSDEKSKIPEVNENTDYSLNKVTDAIGKNSEAEVNSILLDFLDANTYQKKLSVITGNRRNLDDRIINDMAVALDCSISEGLLDQRIQDLITCLQAMARFEKSNRLR